MWNNEEIQNQMKVNWSWNFRKWFFMMRWFWLFYVPLFLLLCTFLLFYDFSYEFWMHMQENKFLSVCVCVCFFWGGGGHSKGFLRNRINHGRLFSHTWNRSSSVSITNLVCNLLEKKSGTKGLNALLVSKLKISLHTFLIATNGLFYSQCSIIWSYVETGKNSLSNYFFIFNIKIDFLSLVAQHIT